MNREEAERRLRSHRVCPGERWFARNVADPLEVVKIARPSGLRPEPLREAKPQATRPPRAHAPTLTIPACGVNCARRPVG
jgi:hypothetical protein